MSENYREKRNTDVQNVTSCQRRRKDIDRYVYFYQLLFTLRLLVGYKMNDSAENSVELSAVCVSVCVGKCTEQFLGVYMSS